MEEIGGNRQPQLERKYTCHRADGWLLPAFLRTSPTRSPDHRCVWPIPASRNPCHRPDRGSQRPPEVRARRASLATGRACDASTHHHTRMQSRCSSCGPGRSSVLLGGTEAGRAAHPAPASACVAVSLPRVSPFGFPQTYTTKRRVSRRTLPGQRLWISTVVDAPASSSDQAHHTVP